MASLSAQMTKENISAQKITTNSLNLAGHELSQVVTGTEPEGFPIDPLALITYGALDLALHELNEYMKVLDSNGGSLTDLALISLSLCNPYFDHPQDWVLNQWYIHDNIMSCNTNNSPLIFSGKFTSAGKYLICINVSELMSGKLEIYVNETWTSSIMKKGVHYKEVTITDPDNDQLKFVVKDMAKGDRVDLFSMSIHAIADRLYNFLIEKITSLASVDAEGYVRQDVLVHTLDEFKQQFVAATKQYLQKLNEHENNKNAHSLTAKDIQAAAADHTHQDYITQATLKDLIEDRMGMYAKNDHQHLEYLTKEAARTIVRESIQEHLRSLISITSMIITKGVSGVIPSRFASTDISIPSSILLPTTINHAHDSSFDFRYGSISTNVEKLMDIAPHVFSLNMGEYGVIPDNIQLPINFCIIYHTPRSISGYRLRIRDAYLKKWSIYNDNVTFLHQLSVTEEDYTRISGNEYVKEIYFENIEKSAMFSILIQDIEILSDTWEFKIEILYEDFENDNVFGITMDGFQFCVPTQGTNRLITVHDRMDPIVLAPDVLMEGIPVYVFGGKELIEDEPSFSYSYYPPEYSSVRKGINAFLDKFKDIQLDRLSPKEMYDHPAFGKLILDEGHTAMGYKLTSIYDSDDIGWKSDGLNSRISIVQHFSNPNVMLMGYLLSWNKADEQFVPDQWSLTIEGYQQDGKRVTVVMDSVAQYYPFYSVEDENIVYHKSFSRELHVSKLTLTMETKKETDPFIALNKLQLFLSERWYSIPQNTMFLGVNPVSQMCLGSARYTPGVGWEPYNLPIGKSCVVPINNLQLTTKETEYFIYNPFLTTDINVSVHNYTLNSHAGYSPSAYITSVTPSKIGVMCENPYWYALAISRNW